MRTHQLRRYKIADGKLPEFTGWLHSTLIPVRVGFGFRVEFQLVDREASEFIWCVSLEGDQQTFLQIQEQYNSSPERAVAFQTFPNCIDSMLISFVDALDLPQ